MLAEFIRCVSEQDESLSNLSLVGVGSGSTTAIIRAEPLLGIPLFNREDQRRAIGEIFEQRKHNENSLLAFPDKVLGAFRKMTANAATIELSYCPTLGCRPKKLTIDHNRLTKAIPKPPKAICKEWVVGRVERLSKDEQQYGIVVADGTVLHCPMDKTKESLYLDCYTKNLTVEVLASFPQKPPSGKWLAKTIHEIIPRLEEQSLIDITIQTESDIDSIKGVVVPKHPLPFDVALDKFAAALTPKDADSLSRFLKECREL